MFKTFACCLEIKPSRQAHKEGRTPHIFLVSSYLSLGEHESHAGIKRTMLKISYLFLMKSKKPVISFFLFMALSLDTFKLQKINTIVESYFQLLVSRLTS